MRPASAEQVLALLERGEEIRSLLVTESLNLREMAAGDFAHPIRFVDCNLAAVDISFTYFHAPVHFEGCSVAALFGMAAYFFAGLVIEHCSFDGATDLSCGGHNRDGRAVVLSETRFGGFADFADCWFEGPVLIRRCTFAAGTNLFGNQGHPVRVRFDVRPVLEDVRGPLDCP